MLDRIGAKRPVVLGSVLAAVGFFLWAGKVTNLQAGSQVIWIIVAAKQAAATAQLQGGSGGVSTIPQFIRGDFASATQEVLYGMGVVMAVAAVVAFIGLKRGVQQAAAPDTAADSEAAGVAEYRD